MLEGLQQIISDRPIYPNTSPEIPQLKQQSSETRLQQTPQKSKIFMDIRINADDHSACKLAIYWLIIILAVIIVAVLSGYVLPHPIEEVVLKEELKGTPLKGCQLGLSRNNGEVVCGSGALNQGHLISNIQKLNQFIVFYLYLPTPSSQPITQTLTFTLYPAIYSSSFGKITLQSPLLSQQIEVASSNSYQQYFYLTYYNELTQGDHYYYQIQWRTNSFSGLRNSFEMKTYVINPQFSIFCIFLRTVFISISIVFTALYVNKYFKMKRNHREILPQQKVILALSILTITYNDPLYPMTILSPASFTSFLSTFWTWNFITALIVVWLFFLSRIRSEQNQIHTNLISWPNIILVGVFYLISMIYRVSLAIHQTQNRPFTDPDLTDNKFISFWFAFSTVAFLFVLFYIFYLYCSIWSKGDIIIWRSTIFTTISFFFFIVTFIIYIGGGFNIFQYSPSKIIFTLTFMNLFSYYLQYMYMPSSKTGHNHQSSQNDQQSIGQGDKQINHLENFDITDISIELENQEGYNVFVQYGGSKISDQEIAAKSYLGKNVKKEEGEGSKSGHGKRQDREEEQRQEGGSENEGAEGEGGLSYVRECQ